MSQKGWTCHGAPQSEARRTSKNNGVARSLSHKRIHRVRPVTGTLGRREVRYLQLNRSQEMRRGKSRGGSQEGRQSIRGGNYRWDRAAPSENVPPRRNSAEDPPALRPLYRSGYPPTTPVGDTVAITELGWGRGRKPRRRWPARARVKGRRCRSIVYLLRPGLR